LNAENFVNEWLFTAKENKNEFYMSINSELVSELDIPEDITLQTNLAIIFINMYAKRKSLDPKLNLVIAEYLSKLDIAKLFVKNLIADVKDSPISAFQ
jgi:hypothetical protein